MTESTMIELLPDQRRSFRAAAHHLHPVVSIAANGLSDAVLKEIDRNLSAHELIKVKIYGMERADRESILTTICSQLACAPIQHIGTVLVLWRPKPAETVSNTAKPQRGEKPKNKKQAAAALERQANRRAQPTAKALPKRPGNPRRRIINQ